MKTRRRPKPPRYGAAVLAFPVPDWWTCPACRALIPLVDLEPVCPRCGRCVDC